MILTAAIILVIAAVWLALAGWLSSSLGLDFRQALLYVPFKLKNRVADDEAKGLRKAASL